MKISQTFQVVNVFVDQEGDFGNPVGIVVDEDQKISASNRQKMATKIGFSEAVFINNLAKGSVSIFNPHEEVQFAGHALVGAAWFIRNYLGKPIKNLMCAGLSISTWQEKDLTWIRALKDKLPPWHLVQLDKNKEIENLSVKDNPYQEHTLMWSWIDKDKGLIRARTFAPDWGIPEDEANGSGSMKLATMLEQPIEILHGLGSIIYAKPFKNGLVDVGGRVKRV